MSIKSQTNNMRRLAVLFNFNLCNIHGKKECGPNGSKQVFLNVGKVFLRALARDLGLHDVTVSSNAGGIGVSGECSLIGMWENGGLYVSISQPACGSGTFDAFKEADLRKWTEDAAELERRCAEQSETSSQAAESLRSEIQALTAELEYGNLTQAEYGRLRECREQCRELESKLSALNEMASAQTPDFDREIREAQEAIGKIKRTMTNVISYVSKRAELTFSQLKMNRVEISLYDVVKSTGEVKDTFKFTYSGRRYDRLSLSEKIRAGMELSELIKRLTGRNYPVFVDNMESVDDLANVRPTGQIIMAKCVSNAPLQVRPIKPIVFAEQRAA